MFFSYMCVTAFHFIWLNGDVSVCILFGWKDHLEVLDVPVGPVNGVFHKGKLS